MEVLKCKMCGGELELTENSSICKCAYCGSLQTLPREKSDARVNAYNRAGHFFMNGDFDKALSLYEKILLEDPEDANAYWSCILCKYGVNYVEDPTTHQRKITVNRTQNTAVVADESYKQAIEYATAEQREIFEREAHEIDEIQKGILAISANEKPFDVFISYKETDKNGERTIDSVLATDLYYGLTEAGYKVFLSRITLEDKLGSEYEPYIYAALNSAKVMVVLGTKLEYFNAPWVKNEWSRYLKIIKEDRHKLLIPAYRDMDPYDLPEEFALLQAQDMSKIGFLQDIIRGIKKVVDDSKSKPERKITDNTSSKTNSGNISNINLIKRMFIFLESGHFEDADKYAERILDNDPECGEAYLGKLMLSLKVKKRSDIANLTESFANSEYYHLIVKYGANDLVEEVNNYLDQVKNNEKLLKIKNQISAHMNNNYAAILSDINYLSQLEQNDIVKGQIKACTDFLDNKIVEAKTLIKEEKYDLAYNLLKKIENYRDVKNILDSINDYYIRFNYDAAMDMMNTEPESAKKLFLDLGDYLDSKAKANECDLIAIELKYNQAISEFNNNSNIDKVINLFEELGDYKESKKYLEKSINRKENAVTTKNKEDKPNEKNKKKKIIITVVICVVAIILLSVLVFSQAHGEFRHGGVIYYSKGDYYEVVDSYGEHDYVVILDEIKGKPVKKIGKNAFKDNHKLLKIIIPQSITFIDDTALDGCNAIIIRKEYN